MGAPERVHQVHPAVAGRIHLAASLLGVRLVEVVAADDRRAGERVPVREVRVRPVRATRDLVVVEPVTALLGVTVLDDAQGTGPPRQDHESGSGNASSQPTSVSRGSSSPSLQSASRTRSSVFSSPAELSGDRGIQLSDAPTTGVGEMTGANCPSHGSFQGGTARRNARKRGENEDGRDRRGVGRQVVQHDAGQARWSLPLGEHPWARRSLPGVASDRRVAAGRTRTVGPSQLRSHDRPVLADVHRERPSLASRLSHRPGNRSIVVSGLGAPPASDRRTGPPGPRSGR